MIDDAQCNHRRLLVLEKERCGNRLLCCDREEEATALKKLNDHKARGESGKQAHAAALAEAEQLRRKADQHNKDLEPHAA